MLGACGPGAGGLGFLVGGSGLDSVTATITPKRGSSSVLFGSVQLIEGQQEGRRRGAAAPPPPPCFANWLLKRDAAVLRGARVTGPGWPQSQSPLYELVAMSFSQHVLSALLSVKALHAACAWQSWQQVGVSLTFCTERNESPGQHFPSVTLRLQVSCARSTTSSPDSAQSELTAYGEDSRCAVATGVVPSMYVSLSCLYLGSAPYV